MDVTQTRASILTVDSVDADTIVLSGPINSLDSDGEIIDLAAAVNDHSGHDGNALSDFNIHGYLRGWVYGRSECSIRKWGFDFLGYFISDPVVANGYEKMTI